MRISDWSSDVCSSDLYLAPIRSRLAVAGPKLLAQFNENAFAALPDGKRYAQEILPDGKDDGSAFARYAAWQATGDKTWRSEEHTSELQSLMRISYAVFCLKKQNKRSSTKRT